MLDPKRVFYPALNGAQVKNTSQIKIFLGIPFKKGSDITQLRITYPKPLGSVAEVAAVVVIGAVAAAVPRVSLSLFLCFLLAALRLFCMLRKFDDNRILASATLASHLQHI